MSVNPLLRSNPIRMMGMASGMDTQSIIDATLRMHQFKIDSQMRNKTLIEWKQKYHNDIKEQITSLRNTYLSNLGSKSLMNRNAFNASTATAVLANGSAAKAVTVTSTVGASVGSMTINQVFSLAKGASATSQGQVSANGNGFTTGQTLGSMEFAGGKITFNDYTANAVNTDGKTVTVSRDDYDAVVSNPGAWSDEYATLSANGNTITISRTDDGKYSWKAVNSGGVEYDGGTNLEFNGEGQISLGNILGIGDVTITDNADEIHVSVQDGEGKDVFKGPLSFARSATVSSSDGDVLLVKGDNGVIGNNGRVLNFVGTTSMKINGQDIEVRSNMTLTELINTVNSNKEANVTMTYDRMTDSFKIESKEIGGSLNDFSITNGDDAGNNLVNLIFGTGAKLEEGSMARVRINNEWITKDTNTFDYRGVFIKLNETTSDEITVNVERDTSKAVDAIVDFIDNYNALIKKLEDMVNSRKGINERGYTPLTEEEKAGMTEKQIEEWEAIAKKGLMRSDSGLERLVSSLRATFFEQIEGTGMSASQLGLTTGSYFGGTGGQIIVDRDKLAAALEADPDKVADVFIRIQETPDGGSEGVGLLYKLNGLMRDYVNVTQSNSMNALERSLKEANERIARMEERMYAEEDKLYRQFAAMETALSKMQSQGDWFSAMLGN